MIERPCQIMAMLPFADRDKDRSACIFAEFVRYFNESGLKLIE
jgi:hypothetical protein